MPNSIYSYNWFLNYCKLTSAKLKTVVLQVYYRCQITSDSRTSSPYTLFRLLMRMRLALKLFSQIYGKITQNKVRSNLLGTQYQVYMHLLNFWVVLCLKFLPNFMFAVDDHTDGDFLLQFQVIHSFRVHILLRCR